MDPYAEFDRNNYPLIKITFTGVEATNHNFQIYLEELLKNYDKKEKIVILFDATIARFPPIKYQKQQAQWMKENKSLVEAFCMGVAYTIPNKAIRTALSLIFKLQKQPVPFKVFADNNRSYGWLSQRLELLNRP